MDKIDKTLDIVDKASDIAYDVAKPVAEDVGGILQVFTSFFKNVVLYPLSCLNKKFEFKAKEFQNKLEQKYNQIPENKRTEPSMNVVGPTLEGLKYNIEIDELREMYANLLASDMNLDKKSKVHPKFAEILKSMNSIDTIVFNYLFKTYDSKYIKCAKIETKIIGTNQVLANSYPDWILPDDIPNLKLNDISRALERLSNYGIIELMYDRSAGGSIVEVVKQKEQVQRIFKGNKIFRPNIELHGTDCILYINDEGRAFAQCVLE